MYNAEAAQSFVEKLADDLLQRGHLKSFDKAFIWEFFDTNVGLLEDVNPELMSFLKENHHAYVKKLVKLAKSLASNSFRLQMSLSSGQKSDDAQPLPYNLYASKKIKKRTTKEHYSDPCSIYAAYLSERMVDFEDSKEVLKLLKHCVNSSVTSVRCSWLQEIRKLCAIANSRTEPKVLQFIMEIFNKKLSEELECETHNEECLGDIKSFTEDFVTFCSRRHEQVGEFPKKPKFWDLLAATVSMYTDVVLLFCRSKSESDQEKEGNKLCGVVCYIFRDHLDFLLDVVIQLSACQSSDGAIVMPLCKKALAKPVGNVDPVFYTKYIVAAWQYRRLFPGLLSDVTAQVRDVAAPADYMIWLRKKNSSISEVFPAKKRFKEYRITKFLLEEATDDLVTKLLDILTDEDVVTEEKPDDAQMTSENHLDVIFSVDKASTGKSPGAFQEEAMEPQNADEPAVVEDQDEDMFGFDHKPLHERERVFCVDRGSAMSPEKSEIPFEEPEINGAEQQKMDIDGSGEVSDENDEIVCHEGTLEVDKETVVEKVCESTASSVEVVRKLREEIHNVSSDVNELENERKSEKTVDKTDTLSADIVVGKVREKMKHEVTSDVNEPRKEKKKAKAVNKKNYLILEISDESEDEEKICDESEEDEENHEVLIDRVLDCIEAGDASSIDLFEEWDEISQRKTSRVHKKVTSEVEGTLFEGNLKKISETSEQNAGNFGKECGNKDLKGKKVEAGMDELMLERGTVQEGSKSHKNDVELAPSNLDEETEFSLGLLQAEEKTKSPHSGKTSPAKSKTKRSADHVVADIKTMTEKTTSNTNNKYTVLKTTDNTPEKTKKGYKEYERDSDNEMSFKSPKNRCENRRKKEAKERSTDLANLEDCAVVLTQAKVETLMDAEKIICTQSETLDSPKSQKHSLGEPKKLRHRKSSTENSFVLPSAWSYCSTPQSPMTKLDETIVADSSERYSAKSPRNLSDSFPPLPDFNKFLKSPAKNTDVYEFTSDVEKSTLSPCTRLAQRRDSERRSLSPTVPIENTEKGCEVSEGAITGPQRSASPPVFPIVQTYSHVRKRSASGKDPVGDDKQKKILDVEDMVMSSPSTPAKTNRGTHDAKDRADSEDPEGHFNLRRSARLQNKLSAAAPDCTSRVTSCPAVNPRKRKASSPMENPRKLNS